MFKRFWNSKKAGAGCLILILSFWAFWIIIDAMPKSMGGYEGTSVRAAQLLLADLTGREAPTVIPTEK